MRIRPPGLAIRLPHHEGRTAEQDDRDADEDGKWFREDVHHGRILMAAFEIGGPHLRVRQQFAPGARKRDLPLTMT